MSDEVFEARVIPGAFEDWYVDVAPRLLASMKLLCGDPHTAADVSAEALSRAMERWARVRTMDAPEGWAYTVAVNVWRRQQRRSALGRTLLRRQVPRSDETRDGSLSVELRSMIAALPERQREVLVLRHVLGLSQAETAATLGIAEGSVASSLHDARRSMRIALQLDDEPEVSR
jgi:RNA polymerase sigma factor (sigma-70 family)